MLPYLSSASQPSLLHMDGFHYCYCEEVRWNLSFFSRISAWFCLDREQGQLHAPEGGARTRAREKAHKRAWPAPELCACFLQRLVSGMLLTARRGEASDVNHSAWVGLQLGQNPGAPFPPCWSLPTQMTTAPLWEKEKATSAHLLLSWWL